MLSKNNNNNNNNSNNNNKLARYKRNDVSMTHWVPSQWKNKNKKKQKGDNTTFDQKKKRIAGHKHKN